jgi:hypothetical protein
MRGRFLGSIWYIKRQNAGARFASAVNKPHATRQNREIAGDGLDRQLPEEMPKAKRGQKKPRLTRGFPMWHFLRSILALAETRGRSRGNFRARGAGQDAHADYDRPDPRRRRAETAAGGGRSPGSGRSPGKGCTGAPNGAIPRHACVYREPRVDDVMESPKLAE